jgi:hypothetical protein
LFSPFRTFYILLLLTGCAQELEPVRGRVLLGGEPLPDATIMFSPEDPGGLYASARTDEKGDFVLQPEADLRGAPAGKYKVHISTYVEGNPTAEPPTPTVPELVPARYNVHTELVREVTPRTHLFLFELEEDGEVVQPGE